MCEILRRKEVRITEKAKEKNQSSPGGRNLVGSFRSVQGRVMWEKTWTGRNVTLDKIGHRFIWIEVKSELLRKH